jgi:PQQ-dependent catabolism-associated CXXCW motif protein
MVRHRMVPLAVLLIVGACAQQPGTPNASGTPWQTAPLSQSAYDNEMQDYAVAPGSSTIRTDNFEAPTPTKIVGAETISTPVLRNMMASSSPPVLVDVLGGKPTTSLPGAVWWPWAGLGSSLRDDTETRLAVALAKATAGDRKKAVVFFCLSKTCWLSYNAAVRAVSVGYTNVYWYRGGRNAWTAAGLPLTPITASDT